MRIWTVHTDRRDAAEAAGGAGSVPATGGGGGAPARRAPVLVPERFSWAAFLLTVLWLLWHRLWLPALGVVLATVAFSLLLPPLPGFLATLALQLLLGFHAQDLRRWALARRGYVLAGLVAAPDEDAALARLIDRRPTLARAALA